MGVKETVHFVIDHKTVVAFAGGVATAVIGIKLLQSENAKDFLANAKERVFSSEDDKGLF